MAIIHAERDLELETVIDIVAALYFDHVEEMADHTATATANTIYVDTVISETVFAAKLANRTN